MYYFGAVIARNIRGDGGDGIQSGRGKAGGTGIQIWKPDRQALILIEAA